MKPHPTYGKPDEEQPCSVVKDAHLFTRGKEIICTRREGHTGLHYDHYEEVEWGTYAAANRHNPR